VKKIKVLQYDDPIVLLDDCLSALKEESEGYKGFTYSAFAKKLGVSAAHLNFVLQRKRALTLELARKMGRELGFNRTQINHFLLLIQNRTDEKIKYLTAGDYSFVQNIILVLDRGKDFEAEPFWISKKLGGIVSENEIEKALEVLKEKKLLLFEGGAWRRVEGIHFLLEDSDHALKHLKNLERMIPRVNGCLYEEMTFALPTALANDLFYSISELMKKMALKPEALEKGEDLFHFSFYGLRLSGGKKRSVKTS
jgi:plasmid maintenance system antidote protein VapI